MPPTRRGIPQKSKTKRRSIAPGQRMPVDPLNSFFVAAPAGLAILDSQLRYVQINETLARMNGRPVGQHVGRTIHDVAPRLAPVIEPIFQRVLATGEPVLNIELSGEAPNAPGELQHRAASFFPIRDRAGSLWGVGVIAVDVTDRKRAEVALHQYAERLQSLSRQLVEVRETEQRTFARELHDEIGQILTALKLVLETSGRQLTGDASAGLREAQALVRDLMERVRSLSLNLRPPALDDLGLLPALLLHCDHYNAQTNVRVLVKHTGVEGRRFPPEVETAAYRIVQEALTNVARHARVNGAIVRLWAHEHILGVQVEDGGIGFNPDEALAAARSSGLTGMRERATLLGGHLTLESAHGSGTRVTAELPL